jgi:hypothetical protein
MLRAGKPAASSLAAAAVASAVVLNILATDMFQTPR